MPTQVIELASVFPAIPWQQHLALLVIGALVAWTLYQSFRSWYAVEREGAPAKVERVLCVCSGNTCRSPMMAAIACVLRPERHVESAGTSAHKGDHAAQNATLVMYAQGAGDLHDHAAQSIYDIDLTTFDRIICATSSHADAVKRLCPTAHVVTLNVSDPFGGTIERYEQCANQLWAELPKALDERKPTADDVIEAIKAILDGVEWDAGTAGEVAGIITQYDGWQPSEPIDDDDDIDDIDDEA